MCHRTPPIPENIIITEAINGVSWSFSFPAATFYVDCPEITKLLSRSEQRRTQERGPLWLNTTPEEELAGQKQRNYYNLRALLEAAIVSLSCRRRGSLSATVRVLCRAQSEQCQERTEEPEQRHHTLHTALSIYLLIIKARHHRNRCFL